MATYLDRYDFLLPNGLQVADDGLRGIPLTATRRRARTKGGGDKGLRLYANLRIT